jgi:hypothetical protein
MSQKKHQRLRIVGIKNISSFMKSKESRVLKASLLAIATGLAVLGCGKTEAGSDTEVVQQKDASAELFRNGFKITTSKDCAVKPGKECLYDALKPSGAPLNAMPKDLKKLGDYTVFTWPKTIETRSYDKLGIQMRQYARYVGTMLHRSPEGPGEQNWSQFLRSEQYYHYTPKARKGADAYCGAVVEALIDTYVPEGSDFRQYGNCGEGGRVGACLAHKAGFKPDEIRVCESKNDHFFAMVRHSDPKRKWCILDRWNLVANENFICDVDWDKETRGITYLGKRSNTEWFQRATCTPFSTYLANGAYVQTLPDL